MKTLIRPKHTLFGTKKTVTCPKCKSEKMAKIIYLNDNSVVYYCMECGHSINPCENFLYNSYRNKSFVSSGIGGYMINRIKFTADGVYVDHFFDIAEKL